MKFALALLIAVHFWGARNVQIPCHPAAVDLPDSTFPVDVYGIPATMIANNATCQVRLSSGGEKERATDPNWYCMDVVHEVGHLAGLGHTPTGLMAEYVGFGDMPYDCRHWRAFRRNL